MPALTTHNRLALPNEIRPKGVSVIPIPLTLLLHLPLGQLRPSSFCAAAHLQHFRRVRKSRMSCGQLRNSASLCPTCASACGSSDSSSVVVEIGCPRSPTHARSSTG